MSTPPSHSGGGTERPQLALAPRWDVLGARRAAAESDDPEPEGTAVGWRALAAVLFAGVALFGALSMTTIVRPAGSAPIVLPLGVTGGLAMCVIAARRTPCRADLLGIFATGLALRLVGMLLRYRSAADALEYHSEGTRIASALRQGDFSVEAGRSVPGTGSLRLVSGALHALLFDDLLAVFVVFTLVSFAGILWFHRAFAVAVGDADVGRYAVLLALWPPLCFWPSSLGKEAVMMAGLGLASLGAAHLLTHQWTSGAALLVAGLLPVGFVRPHIGLLLVAALAVASILRRNVDQSRARVFAKLVVAGAALTAGVALAGATTERFELDNLGTEQITETLDYTARQTTQGGSSFAPTVVSSPLDYPVALVTIVLRPFPGEVGGVEGLVSAFEGILFAVLVLASVPRLLAAARIARVQPYLLYALAFTLAFVYAFSSIGNFGILVRQRTQVLPFLLCLLSVHAAALAPSVVRSRLRNRHDTTETRPHSEQLGAGRRAVSVAATPGRRTPS